MRLTKSKLKQIIKEEMAKLLTEEVEEIEPGMMRNVRDDYKKRGFYNGTPQDIEAVATSMPGYRMIDHTNMAKVSTATQMADPKEIMLLGVSPQHVYFKTFADKYYRIPRLMSETGIDVNTRKQAETDGWKDHKDDGERASHWETFEGGKYLTYWQLGFDNRQEAEGY
jgi:hypothetical protein